VVAIARRRRILATPTNRVCALFRERRARMNRGNPEKVGKSFAYLSTRLRVGCVQPKGEFKKKTLYKKESIKRRLETWGD